MLSQYKNIQVAVDGSKEADLAFSKAVAIAKRNHATLEILHVIDTRSFQNVSSFDSAMVEQVSKDAEKRMKDYQARATKAGAEDVHYSIEFGSPKTIIGHDFPKKLRMLCKANYLALITDKKIPPKFRFEFLEVFF